MPGNDYTSVSRELWVWTDVKVRTKNPQYFRGKEWTAEDLARVVWKQPLMRKGPGIDHVTRVHDFVEGLHIMGLGEYDNLDNWIDVTTYDINDSFPRFEKRQFVKDFYERLGAEGTCVCNHRIRKMPIIGHVLTGITVVVGSDCHRRWFGKHEPVFCSYCHEKKNMVKDIVKKVSPPICNGCYHKIIRLCAEVPYNPSRRHKDCNYKVGKDGIDRWCKPCYIRLFRTCNVCFEEDVQIIKEKACAKKGCTRIMKMCGDCTGRVACNSCSIRGYAK